MKKLLFSIAIMFVVLGSSFGQQALKLGPFGFILGNYNLRYEKALSEKGSFLVGANYYDYKLFDINTTGFGLDAGYRYYFKEAIKGAYLYPYLSYDFNSTNVSIVDETSAKYSLLSLSAMAGYQWVFGGGFVMDLGFGYGYRFEVSKDDSLVNDYSNGGVRFLFNIGYAF